MKMTCPNCGRKIVKGRFCERCGTSLPDVPPVVGEGVAAPSSPSAPPSAPPVLQPRPKPLMPMFPSQPVMPNPRVQVETPGPALEMDAFCILFESLPGFLRFRLNPGTTAENVSISLENPLTGAKVASRTVRYLQGAREITVPAPGQEAGAFVWYLTLTYEAAGRKRRMEGDVQMVVVRPREAQKAADQLTVTINNNITNGNASDVHVSQQAVEELSRLATAENPFEELRRIVLGGRRVWAAVPLDSGCAQPTLPPQPLAAQRDSVTLNLGMTQIRFFANRMVRLGRQRNVNDIALRPPEGMPDTPYRSMSKAHCCFEHQGDKAVVYDGQFDAAHVVKPSSFGTFWNGERIVQRHALSAGDKGVISFAGAGEGFVSLEVRACRPVRACATCPHANRIWCGDGRRPALMLTRRDGVAERFVALWSCFPLEEADPSFEGVVIFRKDGGFAWRRGRRCGWLVPGETMETDFGQVTVN